MPATEKPRAEPEIIPPGDLDGRPMRDRYHFDVHGGSQRIYVTRLGPVGIVVLGLLIALIAAVIPIVLLGAVLIWIPVVVLFVAAAIISDLLRRRDSTEAATSPASAETTDAARDERAAQLVDRLSLWSGAAGLIPVPLVDMAAVGGVQLHMLRRLSEIYGVPFSENRGKSILASLAGAVIPASTATTTASLMKGLPVIGTAIGRV